MKTGTKKHIINMGLVPARFWEGQSLGHVPNLQSQKLQDRKREQASLDIFFGVENMELGYELAHAASEPGGSGKVSGLMT